ncbi:hypothetical protein NW769_014978, partial [Fusarium oxysporum]
SSKGLPQYDDHPSATDENSDVLLISDAEDIIPVFQKTTTGDIAVGSSGRPVIDEAICDGYRVRKFRPRIMQVFSSIERLANLANPDDVNWRAISPVIKAIIFGNDANSRIFDSSSASDSPSRIFSGCSAK